MPKKLWIVHRFLRICHILYVIQVCKYVYRWLVIIFAELFSGYESSGILTGKYR